MKFFFDHCLSPKLAKAMNALVEGEHEVVHLRDKWPEACRKTIEDTVWIAGLAAEGDWIIVSGDLRIRTRPRERQIWSAAKLTTFFLADGFTQQVAWEQVRWLIDKWPDICEQAGRVAHGSAFLVPKRGKLRTF